MVVSPVERPVASSAYGFLRFIGGGLAPYVAGKLADATDLSVPFYLGAGTFLLAIPVLAGGHRLLRDAEARLAEGEPAVPTLTPVGRQASAGTGPVVVAVGAHQQAAAIVDAAARLARDTGSPLEVVHVQRTAVVEELAADTETPDEARAAVVAHLDRLAAQGFAATGQILDSVGDHAAAGRVLARHAAEVHARAVAVGRSPRGPLAQFADGSLTTALAHAATCTVVLVDPADAPLPLTASTLVELRERPDEYTEPCSVASLRLPDGSVRAWGSDWEPVEHLAAGPRLIDLLSASSATPPLTDMPYGGVHFDPLARTVSLWAVQTVAGVHNWPLPGWEDWVLDFRGDDHTRQAGLLPADFPFPSPPLAAALRRLGDDLSAQLPDMSVPLARAMGAPGPEGTTPVVNPAALVPHEPADPTPAELAALRGANDALVTGAEVD